MYGIYSKFIQVIYTLNTNIMILAQGVLQIFCSQSPLWLKCPLLKCLSLKTGIIINIHRILRKADQVTCIMCPNSMPDIMILAQAVLRPFCWQDCFIIQKCQSRKREKIQPNVNWILPKVYQVIYTLDTICESNIMILAQAVLQIFCRQDSTRLQCIRLRFFLCVFYPPDFVRTAFVHITNSDQTIFNVGVSFCADFCKDK